MLVLNQLPTGQSRVHYLYANGQLELRVRIERTKTRFAVPRLTDWLTQHKNCLVSLTGLEPANLASLMLRLYQFGYSDIKYRAEVRGFEPLQPLWGWLQFSKLPQ